MKILICGGRHFCDYALLESIVDNVVAEQNFSEIEIVSGHCVGADRLGEMYAQMHNYKVKIIPAEWEKDGKCAGPIRNKRMIDYVSEFEN